MSNLNIPINKGNYSMEIKSREDLFHKNLSYGWEDDYIKYRNNWIKYAKNKEVSNYPLLVDIELASICNLKCPMCYTISPEYKEKVKAEFINYDLFKKIIDEIGTNVPAIRLSLRGEPTLHPKFLECIKYAKDKGIKEVSTLTNCSKLDAAYFKKAVDAGIDWITISVDGIGENYEKVRKPLKFNETLQKIKDMHKIKEEFGLKKPVIKIQAIWPSIKDNHEEFYNTFADYSDLIAFNPLIDYLEKDEEILYEEDFSCPQHYQRLVIISDGHVILCSNDEREYEIIGDINNQTVYDVWHGKRLNEIRKIHAKKGGFMNIPVCKKCYLPRKTEDSEVMEINGRKFVIKNYVNRSQVIGE